MVEAAASAPRRRHKRRKSGTDARRSDGLRAAAGASSIAPSRRSRRRADASSARREALDPGAVVAGGERSRAGCARCCPSRGSATFLSRSGASARPTCSCQRESRWDRSTPSPPGCRRWGRAATAAPRRHGRSGPQRRGAATARRRRAAAALLGDVGGAGRLVALSNSPRSNRRNRARCGSARARARRRRRLVMRRRERIASGRASSRPSFSRKGGPARRSRRGQARRAR